MADDVKSAYFKVLVDNFTEGEEGKRVSLPLTEQTQALVDAGVVEPMSTAAKEATS